MAETYTLHAKRPNENRAVTGGGGRDWLRQVIYNTMKLKTSEIAIVLCNRYSLDKKHRLICSTGHFNICAFDKMAHF